MNRSNNTFALCTYRKLRKVNIISYLVDQSISIVASIVIAQCVSSVALAAVSIISPLYSIVIFLTVVIADATNSRVQIELGNFDKEKANNILMTGMMVAIMTGVIILALFLFGADTYFSFMGVSETTAQYAEEYLTFIQFSYALLPLNITLDFFIADSANVKLIYSKRGVTLVCNTLLAVIFTNWLGIAGIGLAHLISNITNICLMNTHFRSEFTAVKPRWMKFETEFINALKGALAGGTKMLTYAAAGIIIDKIIISRFGDMADDMLSILGIVGSVTIVECIYEAIVQTARCQLDIYSVEGNYKTGNELIKAALLDCLKGAILVTVIYQLIAPLVPIIYNISDPKLAETCTIAVRLGTILTIFFAAYTAYTCIHQGLQHFVTVALAILTEQLLVYCGLMFLFTSWFDEYGVWLAYGLYPTAAILIILLATWIYTLIHKDRTFPWLLDKNKPLPIVCNVEMTEQQVLEVRDEINAKMEEAGVDSRTRYQMSLVIEEFGMLVAQKNKKADSSANVLAEWDVWIEDDSVTVIVRDNGKTLDFSDEDNSTGSLGAYFLSCLMPNIGQVNYATAVSMNRHRFQVARTNK